MLTHIDVFLGVTMVMLGVSLLVTIATQIVSFLANLRGEQLKRGLAELFAAVGIEGPQQMVERILKHELISHGGWRNRVAPAISKVDLLALIDKAQRYLKLPDEVAQTLLGKKAEIATWFDATMARVSSRFTMRTRIVTIIASVVTAFLLHLDAFGLVSRLYADTDLRAKMAGAAAGLVSQGEAVLATPTVFADAATSLAKEFPEALPPPAKSFQSRDQVETWIHGAVPDPKQAQVITDRYSALVTDAVQPAFKRWFGQASNINDQLAGAGLQLVPIPYRPFAYDSIWVFLGVLTSAALLSLGAPFWFNALKTLSNLRPALASAVEGREQNAPTNPDRG